MSQEESESIHISIRDGMTGGSISRKTCREELAPRFDYVRNLPYGFTAVAPILRWPGCSGMICLSRLRYSGTAKMGCLFQSATDLPRLVTRLALSRRLELLHLYLNILQSSLINLYTLRSVDEMLQTSAKQSQSRTADDISHYTRSGSI